jgi:hypothetical protein
MSVWYSLRPFGIFFPVLVCLDKEKSGNPASQIKNGKRKKETRVCSVTKRETGNKNKNKKTLAESFIGGEKLFAGVGTNLVFALAPQQV